jgi:hypothetical protein
MRRKRCERQLSHAAGGILLRPTITGLLIVSFAIHSAAVSPTRAAEDAEPTAYSPAEFVLSYWSGPPAAFNTLPRYQEVREAHFTIAFPADSGLTVDGNKKLLDFCQHLGLKAIVSDGRMSTAIGGSQARKQALDAIVADYGQHPALLAYHIIDEPSAAAFDGLAEVNAYLKACDPRHPGYINLLPTYGRDFGALGTATYEQYVRQFVEKVKPFVISYDHYHFTNAGDRADFFENLDTVRRVSIDSKIPFWNIVLLTQHFGYRHLSEAELRFEAMQTLAYGGRGLVWFTYWMPAGVPEPQSWKHSMILADGSRDPHYDQVKRINLEVKTLGDVLGACTSTSVFHFDDGMAANAVESPITPTAGRLTIGLFKHRTDGKTLALVANRDYRNPVQTTFRIQPSEASLERFDPQTKRWSPADIQTAITLSAGDGVLLRW